MDKSRIESKMVLICSKCYCTVTPRKCTN